MRIQIKIFACLAFAFPSVAGENTWNIVTKPDAYTQILSIKQNNNEFSLGCYSYGYSILITSIFDIPPKKTGYFTKNYDIILDDQIDGKTHMQEE